MLKRSLLSILLFLGAVAPTFAFNYSRGHLFSKSITSLDTLIKASSLYGDPLLNLPKHYSRSIIIKTEKLNHRLSKTASKALRRLQKQEEKINRKLLLIDSVASHNLFTHSIDSLSQLQDIVKKL